MELSGRTIEYTSTDSANPDQKIFHRVVEEEEKVAIVINRSESYK